MMIYQLYISTGHRLPSSQHLTEGEGRENFLGCRHLPTRVLREQTPRAVLWQFQSLGCRGGVCIPQAVKHSSPSPQDGPRWQAQGERNDSLKSFISLIWQKCTICVNGMGGGNYSRYLWFCQQLLWLLIGPLLFFGDEKCGFRFTVERDELIGLVNIPLIKKSILILQLLKKNHLVGILFSGGTVYPVNKEQTRQNLLLE